MPQPQSFDTAAAPTDEFDGTESQAPAANAFTDTPPGQALPKDGAAHWGVAARWFLFAIIAIGFVFFLYNVLGR